MDGGARKCSKCCWHEAGFFKPLRGKRKMPNSGPLEAVECRGCLNSNSLKGFNQCHCVQEKDYEWNIDAFIFCPLGVFQSLRSFLFPISWKVLWRIELLFGQWWVWRSWVNAEAPMTDGVELNRWRRYRHHHRHQRLRRVKGGKPECHEDEMNAIYISAAAFQTKRRRKS